MKEFETNAKLIVKFRTNAESKEEMVVEWENLDNPSSVTSACAAVAAKFLTMDGLSGNTEVIMWFISDFMLRLERYLAYDSEVKDTLDFN